MKTLTLYQFQISPYCEKTRKVLDYKKIPHVREDVSFLNRKFLKEKTGKTKVPVIFYNNEWVSDSTTINKWVDAHFKDFPVLPDDPNILAMNNLVEDWADEGLAKSLMPLKWLTGKNSHKIMVESARMYPKNLWTKFVHFIVRRVLICEFRQKIKYIAKGSLVPLFESQLDLLDGLIGEKKFIFGDKPYSADFACYGMIKKCEGLEGFELVEKRKNIMRLIRAIDSIPSQEIKKGV